MSNPRLVLVLVDHSIRQAEVLIVPNHLADLLAQADGLFIGRNNLDYPWAIHTALNQLLSNPVPTLTTIPQWVARGVPFVTVTVDTTNG